MCGFTIVELLIVIVVIAVLATISIVSYNGIQARASNTQTIAATKDYAKAYYLYALDNGEYPAYTACLGEGYPGTNGVCLLQNYEDERCFGMGSVSESGNVALNNALKPYMGNRVPRLSMQKIPCGEATYIGGYVWFNSATGAPNFMYYSRAMWFVRKCHQT